MKKLKQIVLFAVVSAFSFLFVKEKVSVNDYASIDRAYADIPEETPWGGDGCVCGGSSCSGGGCSV